MRTGRQKVELLLTDEERSQLQSFARSRLLPAVLCNRARIVLSSADGELNRAIAERLKLTKAAVGKWRSGFIERRIAARGCLNFCVRGVQRPVHGGGRRLRRTTDAVGKSVLHFHAAGLVKRSP